MQSTQTQCSPFYDPSNPRRAVAGAGETWSQGLELVMARFDKLESRFEEIDRRWTKLQASRAAYRRYSSNYDIDPYQQPTRFRPCHEQPPGWPPPQRSPPSCWPAQRHRHAYERQQQTHAYRQQHEPVVAHMEPLNRFSNPPAATTQSRSCHEQPTIVLQPLLGPTSLQRSAIPPMAPTAVPPPSSHLPSTRPTTQLVSCEEMHLGVEGDSQVLNQGDLQLNGMKLVDEELCYETELIPLHHSSSLDQELDAHHKTEENSSVNWMCSFLDEVDESKSSILNDNHDKATFDDDEFTEMECHSVKISDDSDLQGDSSSQKCLDSDDDNEDAAVPLPTSLPAAIPSSMKKREAGTIVDMVVAQTTAIAEKISYLTNVAWAYESVWATGTDVAAQIKISYGVAVKSVALNDWASINLTRKYGREFMKRTESSMFLKSFGWNKFSVIEFDPGGDTSKLQFLTFFVVSWFPP